MAVSLAIGVLTGGGLYLLLQRELVRIVFGFLLISHAVNLLLLSSGVVSFRLTPLLGTGDPEQMADPLPQAFVLTSIVITMATAIYMLTLTVVGQRAARPHDADRTDVADQLGLSSDDLDTGLPVTGDPALDEATTDEATTDEAKTDTGPAGESTDDHADSPAEGSGGHSGRAPDGRDA